MHSIERYGVIALIFLAVTVLAVLMWDDEQVTTPDSGARVATAERSTAAARATSGARAQRDPQAGLVSGTSRPSARPLSRDRQEAASSTQPVRRPDPRPNTAAPASLAGTGFEGGARPSDPLAGLLPAAGTPRSGAPGATAGESQGNRATAGQPVRRPEPRVYVVKPGDTLSEISLEVLGTSKRWQEIVDANPGLDPARLKVNARLRLPEDARASSGAAAAKPKTKDAPAPAGGSTYEIESGDSLWSIAEATLGDGERWRELAALNPTLDPKKLIVGKALVLPSDASITPRRKAPALVAERSEGSSRGRVR